MDMNKFFSTLIAVIVAGSIIGSLMSSALAEESGGTLRIFQYDSPASMSIHEEALNSAENPAMAVFNKLVLFDQHQDQNRLDGIQPELATQWSWNADGTALTFLIREGVKWHDGKPFTATDVQCTWNLILGRGNGQLRANPRTCGCQHVANRLWNRIGRASSSCSLRSISHTSRRRFSW